MLHDFPTLVAAPNLILRCESRYYGRIRWSSAYCVDDRNNALQQKDCLTSLNKVARQFAEEHGSKVSLDQYVAEVVKQHEEQMAVPNGGGEAASEALP